MADLAERLANLTPAKRQLLEQRLKGNQRVAEPIAIIGMACRFPGAPDLPSYWRVIRDRVEATGEIPSTRWDVDALYDPSEDQPGKMSVRWAGMLADVERFDPQFFGISPREAARMDPQQRLLLEVSWEALEVACLAPERLCGTATGVFIGIGGTDYSKIPAQFEDYYQHIDAHVGTGNALSIAANRLSYILDLHGPSLAVDTACSSGLIGVHLAVQSLRNRECDAALAGGVNLILSPETTIAFSKARMLSPDGHCRPFDAAANGYVRGEGCGIIVLKRLTDALREGDHVLAVIRASSANQDGRTSGITAPNSRAQLAVIRAALAQAGLGPDAVSFIEAHGTGTPLGDPIEVQALTEVFRQEAAVQPPCYLGSVKANIGHTETASGLAGIIKVVLMLQHGVIPAQLHFTSLNPHMSLEGSRLRIPTELIEWRSAEGPRVAGVSSFGFGGTNVHVILEETSAVVRSPVAMRPVHLLALSAKTETALAAQAGRYAEHLAEHPEVTLDDLCASTNAGRSHFQQRAAVVARNRGEMAERLLALRDGKAAPGVKTGRARLATPPKVAFLFTGQGSQYTGMGRELFESEPTYRGALEQCQEILRSELEHPLLEVLFREPDANSLLDQTAYTQPALFSLEYALAKLWQSWGIEPSALLGHSVGEYVAACLAGVFDLEQGLKLIATRARLMQQLPQDGSMAVIFAAPETVQAQLQPHRDRVSLAAVNGPENTVISGDTRAVRQLVEQFTAAGLSTQLLTVSHAFHSPLMEPMLEPFAECAERIAYQRPGIPVVSNLTGRLLEDQPLSGRYWRDHVRSPVLFAQGMQALAEQGVQVMLELGPTASLLGMGRRCLPDAQLHWLASLRKGQEDWTVLLQSVAELYLLGSRIDWSGLERNHGHRRLILPTYPFERERYWFDPQKSPQRGLSAARGPALHPLLGSPVLAPLPTRLFEARISAASPKYLADHQVQGSPVFPAAGYVEQALAAARQWFGEGNHAIENLSLQHALFLGETIPRLVQTASLTSASDEATFETYSTPAGEDVSPAKWTLHACGKLRRATGESAGPPAAVDLQRVRATALDVQTRQAFYEQLMRPRGLNYGPSFQVLNDLRRGGREALAEILLPASVQEESSKYLLHPALGDALFQTTAGLVPLESDGSYSPYTYMPVSVKAIRLWGSPRDGVFTYGRRTSEEDRPSPETVEGNVCLLDAQGNVVVELQGVRVQRVGRSLAEEQSADSSDWLYRVAWQPAPRTTGTADEAATSTGAGLPGWLIFADDWGVGEQLAQHVRPSGGQYWLVSPGSEFEMMTGENGAGSAFRLDPLDASHVERLLKEVGASASGRPDAIVHLWSLDIPEPASDRPGTLEDARRFGCGNALQLIRQLARSAASAPRALWLVTRGAQAVDQEQTVSFAQSPLWGLGRVAAMEHPELRCRLIDADPADDPITVARQLAAELQAESSEEQIAYRGGQRLAGRLQRARELAELTGAADSQPCAVPAAGAFRLRLGTPGSFDSLRLEPFTRPAPGPGQVEVEVHAAGLNFSDVLKAMGLYPGLTDEVVPLGIECSGVVTAVGEGVTRFTIGDRVMGVAPFSFASHAITAEYALVHRPDQLDDAEAATAPITFLTAYYALVHLARLERGERVLIHAGAGGVGLAAIQIAQHIGAEIFATAGSDAKREFLRSLGVPHVFSSRNLDFADQILAATDGQGVDVVLNSLPGDAITKSLGILRAYGRFLEIGKTDIYQNRMIGLLPFQDNLSYYAIDLDRMLRQRPDTIRRLFAEVIAHFQNGTYRPLPRTDFAVEQTVEAFRYMAARKNIGKVIVTLPDAGQRGGDAKRSDETAAASRFVRSDGSYLITGGLGALGLQLARWLVERGAGQVVLMSRRQPSEEVAAELERLRDQGAHIRTVQADVTDLDSLRQALSAMAAELPPLRGVVHAAGVLADGLLFDMDLERLDRAMRPKTLGSWNLHVATQGAPLDFFVLFSSVACVLGNPGQANYAAGNAFLDGLAEYRRRQGLPALSVNWGPWGGSGMAAAAGIDAQLRARGLYPLDPRMSLDVLERLITARQSNVAVANVHWPDLLKSLGSRTPALLRDLATVSEAETAESAGVDQAFRDELLSADDETRQARLRDYFAEELARIMGIANSDLDLEQPLNEIGMDSLLASELKNNLERRLAFTLPMAAFLERPSVASLAAHAAKALGSATAEASLEPGAAPPGASMWSPLVPFATGQQGNPLFCVHPLGGDVNCYFPLAQVLQDRPLVALRGRGGEGLFPPHTSLNEMIDTYLAAIKSLQPRGPYHVAGWSAGGIFAYELARRLRAAGDHVALLALLDTPLPSIYDTVHLDDDIQFLFELGRFANWFSGSSIDVANLSYETLRAMDEDSLWQFVHEMAIAHGVLPRETVPQQIRRIVQAGKSHAAMIRGYSPVAFDQTVCLVRPELADVLDRMSGQSLGADLGWGSVLGNRLLTFTSPGDHFSMLSGDHAARLAEVLSQ